MEDLSAMFEPLGEAELDRLAEFLLDRVDEDAVTEGKDEGVLDVSELDGFLTAVVSAPVLIRPSQWVPALWGDFPPERQDEDDMQEILLLIMRLSNSIAAPLMEQPEAFEPIFLERRVKGKKYTIVDEWCEGYMRGVALAAGQWAAGGSEMDALLAPIRAFTEQTDWYGHTLKGRAFNQLRDAIALNARVIHAYWLARREQTG
jgi:uncharacterized protein